MKQKRSNSIFALDNKDKVFELIKNMAEVQGLTYGNIAELLSKQGWVGRHNNKLTQPVVSRFMIAHGYRVKSKHTKNRQSKDAILMGSPPSNVEKRVGVQERLDMAVEILDSEIDMGSKLALVKKMLKLK